MDSEADMATLDAITEARRRYLDSPRSRRDWMLYVQTVEALRRQEAVSQRR